jgi:hypothetical protein
VSPHYAETVPSAGEWLVSLGPATLLALGSLLRPRDTPRPGVRPHVLRLQLWVAIALLIVVLRPVSFSLQFGVGIGLPLLVLAAVGLVRWRHALEVSVPLMATTAVVYASLCARPHLYTHPPAERPGVANALGAVCRPGEIVLAPPDIGLYVGGVTSCWPFVSHPAAPDYLARVAVVERFYASQSPPAERARWLEHACIKHLVLPTNVGAEWLGSPSAYRPTLVVTGASGALAVWSRDSSAACKATPSYGEAAGGVFR